MDASPLGTIPPELRNNIFESIIVIPSQVRILVEDDKPGYLDSNGWIQDALALMATCKQARQECLPTFFAVNKFAFHTGVLGNFGNIGEDVRVGWRDSEVRRKTRVSAWFVRDWFYSHNLCTSQMRPITVDLGVWDPHADAREGPSGELVAWAAQRFRTVSALANVQVKFRLDAHLDTQAWCCNSCTSVVFSTSSLRQDEQVIREEIEEEIECWEESNDAVGLREIRASEAMVDTLFQRLHTAWD